MGHPQITFSDMIRLLVVHCMQVEYSAVNCRFSILDGTRMHCWQEIQWKGLH